MSVKFCHFFNISCAPNKIMLFLCPAYSSNSSDQMHYVSGFFICLTHSHEHDISGMPLVNLILDFLGQRSRSLLPKKHNCVEILQIRFGRGLISTLFLCFLEIFLWFSKSNHVSIRSPLLSFHWSSSSNMLQTFPDLTFLR